MSSQVERNQELWDVVADLQRRVHDLEEYCESMYANDGVENFE